MWLLAVVRGLKEAKDIVVKVGKGKDCRYHLIFFIVWKVCKRKPVCDEALFKSGNHCRLSYFACISTNSVVDVIVLEVLCN